ncbi:hypothetical protein O181_053997 [Austropuccinia psidii MF-1]|uniref:Uncharacterized protein n=1 Tax=Austropuccinia psidii MF-1 TaxID=1389203 RepID=A0A9Q3E601_9BASI|nr:hypothetical protein [Austropuccinia psidii MF-1]
MSIEDQVNLNSYANTFISSQFFFSRFKYLWNPHIQSVSAASTGFYLILVLRSPPFKVGQYCHNHKECPSSIGVAEIPTWDHAGAYWPHHIFMANLASSGALWHFGHITLPWPLMASGHILPSLSSLANSSISPTPRSLSLFLGLGVS